MSKPLSISLDVLLVVVEHLHHRSDVATMSRASKLLRAACIRRLLRFGVTISTEQQLASFVAFLRNDVAGRAPHIRTLCINLTVEPREGNVYDSEDDEMDDEDGSMEPSAAACLRLLPEVLSTTTELEDLSIDSCEEILEREPGVLKAIVSLKNLRRLQVSSVGELTASLFENIGSSLVEVDLHCYDFDGMSQPDDPVFIVKKHHATLERLSASYVEVQHVNIEFPRLRVLALRNISSFDASVLRKLFPNLEYLELSPGAADFDDPEDVREASCEQRVDGSWNMLGHLCGSVDAVYGLGHTRAVKRVDVDDFSLTPKSLARLHTVVGETSPSCLLVHIGYCMGKVDGANIPELLRVPEASSISRLVLDVCLSTLKATPESLMDGLAVLLAPLSISFFVLRLNSYVESDERALCVPDQDSSRCNVKVYEAFQPPAHDALVQQLADACLQLNHISFDIMGHIPTLWGVTRTDGDVTIRKLEAMVGRELVYREGVWFNDRSLGLSKLL